VPYADYRRTAAPLVVHSWRARPQARAARPAAGGSERCTPCVRSSCRSARPVAVRGGAVPGLVGGRLTEAPERVAWLPPARDSGGRAGCRRREVLWSHTGGIRCATTTPWPRPRRPGRTGTCAGSRTYQCAECDGKLEHDDAPESRLRDSGASPCSYPLRTPGGRTEGISDAVPDLQPRTTWVRLWFRERRS